LGSSAPQAEAEETEDEDEDDQYIDTKSFLTAAVDIQSVLNRGFTELNDYLVREVARKSKLLED